MAVMGVAKFERFFRLVAGLDVDKDDLKRFNEFINKKLVDLLIRDIVGGLGVALTRSFKIIEPDLKNPMTEHWERSYRIFDLLL
jgi:hypothetical protein